MNDEDYEDDDDDIFPAISYRIVESKPVTKYTFIHFGFSLVTGLLRTVMEATCDLADAFVGAEGYSVHQRKFQDEVRIALDTIVDGRQDGD